MSAPLVFPAKIDATFHVEDVDVDVLNCICADGEAVTVLVAGGEPGVQTHPLDMKLARVVRSDGTVIVDNVKTIDFRGPHQRRADLRRRRAIVAYTAHGVPIFGNRA